MDIPVYVTAPDQENYNQLLNQILRDNLSDNGLIIPSITNAQLTVDTVLNANTEVYDTLANTMPNGTMWLVTDASPPIPVMKINNALYKFSVTTYP